MSLWHAVTAHRLTPGLVRPRRDDAHVPRISEFYGIVIAMYYREHGMPHFHATYAGERL